MGKGEKLLQKFLREEVPKIQKVLSVEKKFELSVTSLPLPFIGIVDLTAEVEGQTTIVDFKTAACAYEEHEVALSDQLTAYWLADPQAQRVALCVLVKTKEPRIEWHFAERDAGRLAEYLIKIRLISEGIAAGSSTSGPASTAAIATSCRCALGIRRESKKRWSRSRSPFPLTEPCRSLCGSFFLFREPPIPATSFSHSQNFQTGGTYVQI